MLICDNKKIKLKQQGARNYGRYDLKGNLNWGNGSKNGGDNLHLKGCYKCDWKPYLMSEKSNNQG